MSTISRAGAAIAYAAGAGEGPAVVLLHNIFTNRSIFDHTVAALRDRGFRPVAIDFRGHGKSAAAGARRYTVADLVEDVVAVLDHERIARATLAGVSLGATVALELALAHPARVAGLVLMGAYAEPDGGVAAFRNALFCRLVGIMGMRWFVLGGVLRTIFGAWFRTHAPERFAMWRARLAAMSPRLACRAMQAWTGRRSLLAALPRISVPTRVVVGDDDVSCPLPCGQKVQRALPDAELVRIPQAGHTMPAERPAEVTATLLGFLDHATTRVPTAVGAARSG